MRERGRQAVRDFILFLTDDQIKAAVDACLGHGRPTEVLGPGTQWFRDESDNRRFKDALLRALEGK